MVNIEYEWIYVCGYNYKIKSILSRISFGCIKSQK